MRCILQSLFVCVLVFSALKIIAYAIPVNYLHDNLYASAEIMLQEGGNYYTLEANNNATRVDNFTSSIMLNIAGGHHDANIITGAFRDERYVDPTHGEDEKNGRVLMLLDSIDHGNAPLPPEHSYSYARYWHGYLLFIKILLLFFDINGIRYVYNIVLSIAVGLAAGLLARCRGLLYSVSYIVSFVIVYYNAAMLSLSLGLTFHVATIASIILIVRYSKKKEGAFTHTYLCCFFFYVGAVTTYLDLLCTPIITLGIPLLLLFVLHDKIHVLKDAVLQYVFACCSWCLGYVGLWCAKWILSSIILGSNVLSDGFAAVGNRSNIITNSPFSAIAVNVNTIAPFFIFVLAILVLVAAVSAFLLWKRQIIDYTPLFVSMIGLSPYCWYFFIAQHSTIHYWFTFRSQIIAVMALLFIISSVACSALQKREACNL